MAKVGEGDDRWIVQERADGTNVHNWHWAERDCIEWARKRLGEILGGLTILGGQGNLWIKTTSIKLVEGEAYVNIRKGKIIPGYELQVKLNWEGEVREGEAGPIVTKASGVVEIPYLADENASEDPELKVGVSQAGPMGDRLREAMVSVGKPLLLQKVKEFVQEMAAGGPAKDEIADIRSGRTPPSKSTPATEKTTSNAVQAENGGKTAEVPKEKKGFRSIRMSQQFRCRKQDLFEVLTDERRWMAFTQAKAEINAVVGGKFSLFHGSVSGEFQKLKPPSLIVQKWRFNSWDDGVYSTVSMSIEEPEVGSTVLKLTHTNIPEEDKFGNATVLETTERGWRDLIFHKIRAVFGYGV